MPYVMRAQTAVCVHPLFSCGPALAQREASELVSYSFRYFTPRKGLRAMATNSEILHQLDLVNAAGHPVRAQCY